MYETYTVATIMRCNHRTKILSFDRPLTSEPGQFVMAWLPGVGEKPYSVAGDAPFSIMVVAVGPFSQALHTLEPADRVWVRGPLGHAFYLPAEPMDRHVLLVGGGYGVAPLRFLAGRAVAAGARVDVCIGAATAEDVLLRQDFAGIGASVKVSTEDGSLGRPGLVTEAALESVEARRPAAVYGCGPVPMLEALERLCFDLAIPHQLSWEAQMRCGMGLCGACEVQGRGRKGWLACTDGPVHVGKPRAPGSQ